MPDVREVPAHSGILPYRSRNGTLEVLLVTSSTRKRWIIPKGHVEKNLTARESAMKEAYEEAGIRGRVPPVPLGRYRHESPPEPAHVEVFVMEVETELPTWPEAHRRERRWMSLREACDHVLEPGLKRLINELAELMY
jgi:8-oxo-dGTP pyrophosphatase MutT (NUDIX family)